MRRLYVDSVGKLHELCSLLRDSRWLAVDTEFMREKTYFPRLCLLQVADQTTAACIDPLTIGDLSPLLDLLYEPACIKVFHAARQDLEIFLNHWDRLPAPIFDTQIAAMLSGLGEQIGYGALVKVLLDVDLEKGHTRTDWCRRPLDADQLAYAYDDVIHLGEVYLRLHARLESLGRLRWLEEDFGSLADRATYRTEPEEAWRRVKGRQVLRGVQRAVLQRLAGWREGEAQSRDRPRRWVLGDEVLIDLARRMPRDLGTLARIRGLEGGAVARWGERLLALIAQGRGAAREDWPEEEGRGPVPSAAEEALADLLSAALRLLAEAQHISPAAVASRGDLTRIACGERAGPLLHGWRRALAGERLLDLAEGRRAMGVVAGQLQILPAIE